MVRVQDKRLGIMHYVFTLTIFLYIVVGVLLVDKEYLFMEAPEGTVRVGLLPPGACPDGSPSCEGYRREVADLHPSCIGFTGDVPPDLLMPTAFGCRYADENFVVWPAVEQRGVFATTRVTESEEQVPAAW